MRLPFLQFRPPKKQESVGAFYGVHQNLIIGDGEFSDMKNISDRYYPAVASRLPRGAVQETYENPNGLLWKNALFVCAGTSAYYDGAEIEGLQLLDEPKQLIGMGAYIIILPDYIVFNTADSTWERMASTWEQDVTVTYEPLTAGSVYTKISAAGIGTYFNRYDAVTIEGCNNANLNGSKIISEKDDDYIVVLGTTQSSTTQASGITISRSVPRMDFMCEYNNRLWGCSSENHEIYASKLGDPFNWNVFEGLSTDSYVTTVGSDGDFTACVAHMGYLLFFKETTIHVMYGDKPSNYQLTARTASGVRKGCSRSLTIIDETLYYVGMSGVYAYNGAIPNHISANIRDVITDGVGSYQDGKYYLSCKMNGEQRLIVYDPKYQIWDIEDDTEFRYATSYANVLTYLDAEGNLRNVTGEDDEEIDWYLESGELYEGDLNEKYIGKLMFNFWLSDRSQANVLLQYDDEGLWHKEGSVIATENRTFTFDIIPHRCSKFRFRIEGKGEFKLIGLGRTVEGGTELHGTVRYRTVR